MKHITTTLVLLLLTVTARATDWQALSPSRADVAAACNLASNGDRVLIPPGTATWSSNLTINKSIKLQGAGVGLTIIRDNVQSGPFLTWQLFNTNQNSEMSDIEFQNGGRATQDFNGAIVLAANGYDSRRMIFSNCKFDHLNNINVVIKDVLGVEYNCTYLNGFRQAHQIYHCAWNGRTQADGSWEDASNFGTDKFWVSEDCTFVHDTGTAELPDFDGYCGARYVVRHSVLTNTGIGNHGTETTQRSRSGRAVEVYYVTYNAQSYNQLLNIRGGVGVFHHNTIATRNAGSTQAFVFSAYRRFYNATPWGIGDGRNVWDKNLAGGPFATGTVLSSSGTTLTVSGTPYTPGQWVNYSVHCVTGCSGTPSGFILSNTSNSITWSTTGGNGANMAISAGGTFEIWKVTQILDQPGVGNGSLITGSPPVPPAGWNNQDPDPWYAWENYDDSGGGHVAKNVSGGWPIQSGVHYINGVVKPGYTELAYPHPLRTGIPTPTPTATPTATATPTPSATPPGHPTPRRKRGKGLGRI